MSELNVSGKIDFKLNSREWKLKLGLEAPTR